MPASSVNEAQICEPFRRQPNPGPRVSMGTALCQLGFDEHAIAAEWLRVVGRLKVAGEDKGGVQKLLVDVLKELSRQVESSNQQHRSGDAPVIVQLVHTVSRPERALPAPAAAIPPAPEALDSNAAPDPHS